MCFFRKKKKSDRELLLESRKAVGDNASFVDVLLVLADRKEEVKTKLKSLQEKLKYLTSSTDEKVKSIDNKIKDLLSDAKIELSKNRDGESAGKTERIIEDIKLQIAERGIITSR